MKRSRDLSGPGEIASAAHLRALLDLARLLRANAGLTEVMTEVARIVSDALGFETVVINLYRAETDTYEVVTVHGNQRARALLLGDVTPAGAMGPDARAPFPGPRLVLRPRRGAGMGRATSAPTPPRARRARRPGSWHPEDALFATLDGAGAATTGSSRSTSPATAGGPTRAAGGAQRDRRPRCPDDRERIALRPAPVGPAPPSRGDRVLTGRRDRDRLPGPGARVQSRRRTDLRLPHGRCARTRAGGADHRPRGSGRPPAGTGPRLCQRRLAADGTPRRDERGSGPTVSGCRSSCR